MVSTLSDKYLSIDMPNTIACWLPFFVVVVVADVVVADVVVAFVVRSRSFEV